MIKSGQLIVFEGLDAAGKTTQAEFFMGGSDVLVSHQPSGAPGIGKQIYQLTEGTIELNPTARQFLHLACHAQHWQDELLPALASGKSVLLDRFWWSTVAYGYFDGEVANGRMTPQEFMDMVQLTMPSRLKPSIVFYFNSPYAEDRHNTERLVRGYEWLASYLSHPNNIQYPIYRVPMGNMKEVHTWIMGVLKEEGILQ